MKVAFFYLVLALAMVQCVFGQAYIGGAYDFGQGRYGERRGDLGPAAIAGVTIGAVAVAVALIVTVYFCYYASSNSGDVASNYPNTKYHAANNS